LILKREKHKMGDVLEEKTFVNRNIPYILNMESKFIIIENVPARVCVETGEQFFSPSTVERLQEVVWQQKKPHHLVEIPVFEFVADS